MADRPAVSVYYSLQSDYCYFLLDRLLTLSAKGIAVDVKPVLGGVIRAPERFRGRDGLEQAYFGIDTARTAAFLGLPYAPPDPSPIRFKPGSVWTAEEHQPLNEWINRLFVAAWAAGRALPFLDHVSRMMWDGSTPGWDEGEHITNAISRAGLTAQDLLVKTTWEQAQTILAQHGAEMLANGHWGVPLMVFQREPFYGQDRFDQLLWRIENGGAHQ